MTDRERKEGARIFLQAITKVQAGKGQTMTAKTMAEPLARRNFEAEYDDLRWDELTDSVKQGWVNDAQAIIDFLSAAGFGLVADAKAEALEEAGAAAADPSPEDMDTYFLDQADVGRWLHARAAALRDAS